MVLLRESDQLRVLHQWSSRYCRATVSRRFTPTSISTSEMEAATFPRSLFLPMCETRNCSKRLGVYSSDVAAQERIERAR